MIRRYNRYQITMAVLAILGGLFCSWLGFLFFRYVPSWAIERFEIEVAESSALTIGLVGLLALYSSGYAIWKKGGGLTSPENSVFYLETLANSETGGAYQVHRSIAPVTGTSYFLSQLFLAGPLMIFNAISRIKNLIPLSDPLETRMKDVLAEIKGADKWQGLEDYPGKMEEIRYLARISAIDFGAAKGVPRFRFNKNFQES